MIPLKRNTRTVNSKTCKKQKVTKITNIMNTPHKKLVFELMNTTPMDGNMTRIRGIAGRRGRKVVKIGKRGRKVAQTNKNRK